ncbi:LysR family transcriptional regulator [Hydrogenophaga taeniospiralis CCUG 15921]|uniref:LysR family transcriptional regulator n=1 Tax=Hydrogenophaga taeniospiralis CCUG 15921 TaxID=1281780 RepID=A0A9X4S6T5_9BURK|nr:LysR family transcriptional regulator [Hydrogenophaga taeniospiralis]MDG5974207.1 LysR family transcriptional regulator [Hydrogenophaga taeniospiralis CCUG 15921]
MNLRYLQYLRLVIEHGSFASAARAGGVSQPAISHGMTQLQRRFDTPLFVRSGRKLLPTEAALHAALKSLDLAERMDALTATGANPANRDTLLVGVTPSAALVCGPALHVSWCQGHPRRRLDMSSTDEGRMLASLQGGELDLVISPQPRGHHATGLDCQPLYQLTPLVYARRAHPLVKAQSLVELQATSWAIVGPSVSGPVDMLHEAFAVRGMKPPPVAASCPDYASLLHLMTHSDLLGVLPHPALLGSAPKGQVVPLRLREALPRYEMHLFTPIRSRRDLGPVFAGLQRQAALISEAPGLAQKSTERQV